MKPIVLLFLKMFVFMGIFFGLLTGLIDYIFDGTYDLQKIVFRMVFFGGFMSLGFGLSQIYGLKKIGVKEFTADNLSVRQTRVVLSNLGIQDLFSKLKADPETQKLETAENGNLIIFKTSLSMWSWGEKVTIHARKVSDTTTEYVIESRPKMRTHMVDSGRNLRNVMRIEELMT